MFFEARMNSYSIDAICGEDSGAFSQSEITGLVQSFLNQPLIYIINLCQLPPQTITTNSR